MMSSNLFKAEYDQREDSGHANQLLAENFPHKAPASEPHYVHDRLENAEQQIRLLQIKPGTLDDDIELRSSVWSLRDVRPFFAISYTWGSTDLRLVWIDGQAFQVRVNCHYALWQARSHRPGAFLWIDSICVDQTHSEEKSKQVRVMADIYAAARCVLVAIGSEDEDSYLIAQFTAELAALGDQAPQKQRISSWKMPASEDQWSAWEASTEDSDRRLVFEAFPRFAQRPYWSRLWIVQETAAARCIEIMCGTAKISWNALIRLAYFVAQVLGQIDSGSTVLAAFGHDMIRVLAFAHLNKWSIERACDTFAGFRCTDPRDHIFGALSLLGSERELLSSFPDYSLTAFDVASKCVPHLTSLGGVIRLLSSLEIGVEASEIRSLCAHKQVIKVPTEKQNVNFHGPLCTFKAGPGDLEPYCLYLDHERDWKLTEMGSGGGNGSCSDSIVRIRRSIQKSERLSSAFQASSPKYVYAKGSNIVALTCSITQLGDILVSLGDWRFKSLLVIRHVADTCYDIIGQAFIMDDICMPRVWSNKLGEQQHNLEIEEGSDVALHKAAVQLNMLSQDALSLMGQDLVRAGRFDLQARLQRLVTPPVQYPSMAAKVTNLRASQATMHKCAQSEASATWKAQEPAI